MQKRTRPGLLRLLDATVYSLRGLRAAYRGESAFRQELAVMVVLLPSALWLGEDAPRRALLILSALAILVTELINSAIEAAVDRIGPEHHKLSGRAKDLGSAAVFISLTAAGIVWGLVAWERFG